MLCGAVGVLVVLILCGCRDARPPAAAPPPDPSTPAGRVARFECNRCHDASGKLAAAPREKSCAGCHQAIFRGDFRWEYLPSSIEKWKRNIKHFRDVPSLNGLDGRVRRDWLVRFLQQPHDLRPNLGEQMPRMPITAADAELIAEHFIPKQSLADPSAPFSWGDARRGAEALHKKGCLSCHAMSGASELRVGSVPVKLAPEAMARAVKQAPDLRHVREKMTPAQVMAWLKSPTTQKADAAMPTIPMTTQERLDLTTLLFKHPLRATQPEAPPALLPPLTRPVRHAEVEREVFKRVCWHCHSDPAGNGGDGGPGNTGGLGFSGKGLDFGSRAAILQYRAYLAEEIDGVPRLVWHLQARHAEARGHTPHPTRRGMPLGLPPLSPRQIQLVHTWVHQGFL